MLSRLMAIFSQKTLNGLAAVDVQILKALLLRQLDDLAWCPACELNVISDVFWR